MLFFSHITLHQLFAAEFVAMPLGEKYTVEGQITGAEGLPFPSNPCLILIQFLQDVGGIRIDTFPIYDTSDFSFSHQGRMINLYKCADQLGLQPGASIQLLLSCLRKCVLTM
jgi:hypothetical protein